MRDETEIGRQGLQGRWGIEMDGSNITTMADALRGVAPNEFSPSEQVASLRDWVAVCVGRIAAAVARTEMGVFLQDTNGKEEEVFDLEDPVKSLIENPNPSDSEVEFWVQVINFLELTGNAVLLKVYDGFGLVRELWPLPSHKIQPELQDNMLGFRVLELNRFIPATDCVHLQYANPRNRFWGLGTLSGAANSVRLYDKIRATQLNVFDADVMANLYLKTDQALNPSEWKRILRIIADRYASPKHAGVPLVLDSDWELKRLRDDPSELPFIESSRLTRDDILAVFGVGPNPAGVAQTMKTDAEAQRQSFLDFTVRPKLVMIQQRFTKELGPSFAEFAPPGRRYVLRFSDPTCPTQAQKNSFNREQVRSGIMTSNEASEAMGRRPTRWGSAPKWAISMLHDAGYSIPNSESLPLPSQLKRRK